MTDDTVDDVTKTTKAAHAIKKEYNKPRWRQMNEVCDAYSHNEANKI